MTRSRSLLALGLLLALGAAFAAGFAFYRARGPSRALRVGFGDEGAYGYNGYAEGHEGPEMRFVGATRLAIAEEFIEPYLAYHCRVWSIDSGKLERTLDKFPTCIEPGTGRALVWERDQPLKLVDLTTGKTSASTMRIGASAISPTDDVVAVIATITCIEMRSLQGGAPRRTIPIPEPRPSGDSPCRYGRPFFSSHGERLAVQFDQLQIVVHELRTETWYEVGTGFFQGFASTGVVYVPWEAGRTPSVVLARRDGSQRVLDAIASRGEGGFTNFALSASGERFAHLRPGREDTLEVLVELTETGEIVRRVPVARGAEVRSLALSPEGDRLAIAHKDGLVEVWETP